MCSPLCVCVCVCVCVCAGSELGITSDGFFELEDLPK